MDVGEEELAVDDHAQQSALVGVSTLKISDGVERNVVVTGRQNERLVVSEELEEELQENRAHLVDPGDGHWTQSGEEDVRRSQMLYSGSSTVAG